MATSEDFDGLRGIGREMATRDAWVFQGGANNAKEIRVWTGNQEFETIHISLIRVAERCRALPELRFEGSVALEKLGALLYLLDDNGGGSGVEDH
jgi:hypothetical protein